LCGDADYFCRCRIRVISKTVTALCPLGTGGCFLNILRSGPAAVLALAPYSCLQPKGAYTPRVESSPIQSSQTQKDAAVTLWLSYNGSRNSVYTPAESSRVASHESCRVKSLNAACSIFVSQTLVIGRDGCYLQEEMDVEKLILLVKGHEAIYDASRCEHRNRVLH